MEKEGESMSRENPDQIDSRLWQNDYHRGVPEFGGCGGGCLSAIVDLLICGFVIMAAISVIVGLFKSA